MCTLNSDGKIRQPWIKPILIFTSCVTFLSSHIFILFCMYILISAECKGSEIFLLCNILNKECLVTWSNSMS
jgi:hypothetical protein